MRFPVNRALPLAALVLLGSGGAFAATRAPAPPAPVTGPAADYPVVVGEPFTIGTVVWTPSDQLNYDAVGIATIGEGAGITGASKTLPLPSYVEVTALDSGRTALVRIERRGPMTNDVLVELSPDAAAQLGLAPGSRDPVRVRRVNPPEQERAALRSGGCASDRLATPDGLLKVLRRKLADQSPTQPPPSTPPTMPKSDPGLLPMKPVKAAAAAPKPVAQKPAAATPAAPKPAKVPTAPAPAPVASPVAAAHSASSAVTAPAAPAPKPSPKPVEAAKDAVVVQVAAFSSQASARKVADQLGASVSASGKFWRVRMGPYTNRAQAAPALEKAKASGYSDARILGAD